MAKLVYDYGVVDLVECPSKWEHYKNLWFMRVPLLIYESENKYPGRRFFFYGTLHSSMIKNLWTTQETIDSPVYVNIETVNSFYKFKLRRKEDN